MIRSVTNLPPSIINNLFMFMYYTILKKQTYKTIENLDFNKLFDNMYQPEIITNYNDIKAYKYTLILPTENIKTNVIYAVPSDDPKEKDVRIEYVYINDSWEILGNTKIDLSNAVIDGGTF